MVTNVLEYLENSAKYYCNKPAFSDEKRTITFGQLQSESFELAKLIIKTVGGKTNLPITVYLPKSADCVKVFMSVLYSGNFYVPLDVSMPFPRLEKILQTLETPLIITDSTGAQRLNNYSILNLEQTYSPAGITDEYSLDVRKMIVDTDPIYAMFTSGSTGVPKGVVISHRSVIDYAEWLADTFIFNKTTIFGNQAPFYFDNSILDIYSTLKNGCEMVIIPEDLFLSAKRLCGFIEKRGINTIFWVPSMLVLCANARGFAEFAPKNLEQVLFCGEVMPNKQLNIWRSALPKARYANLYGPTEITDVCSYYIIDRSFNDDEPLPIGFQCRNTKIVLLDASDGVGEICVGGSCLSLGYYNAKDKTNAVFVQNPHNKSYNETLYRTGDLGRYNEHGELMYCGRKDYQIKHMGHRIELGEIETAANGFDGIEMCCALYDTESKQIVLFANPVGISEKKLYACLKNALPHYMLPAKIQLLDEMPLNANGKIDRIKLKELF